MILERMAQEIGLPIGFLINLANAASYEYKTYQIPKRTGGYRTIHHPSRRLKALQRWLLTNIIEGFPVHPAAMAYAKGSSILKNASPHVTSRYLLRMDLMDFFPSITRDDIRGYIANQPHLFAGWSHSDMNAFCNLVCRASALTIGAPTSPALSNAVCYEMDAQLHVFCSKNRVTYTRYADDLFFSSTQPNVLRQVEEEATRIISHLKVPGHLRVNSSKTRHSSKRGARRVTGIVLGSDARLHVGRRLKRRVRALIHQFDSLDEPARASLAGLIAFAIGFDPAFLNSLIQKYGLTNVRRAMREKEKK